MRSAALRIGSMIGLAVLVSGCSIKKMAVNSVAGSFSSAGGEVFASDDDPQLIREATPFALKTFETLLVESPGNRRLLLATARGFTQYAYAFVQLDADRVEIDDYAVAELMRARAVRLYLRARDYGLRGLELDHEGFARRIRIDPDATSAEMEATDVPLLYWTSAAWGAAIALAKDRPELVADLQSVIVMVRRAAELDEAYGEGAIQDLLISLESLPANLGGSLERAREHFRRSLELSGGRRAGTYVTMAENVAVQTQDRKEFERLLGVALAIDPDDEPSVRLQNIIAQDRARFLLSRVDDLFLDLDTDTPEEP